MNTNSLRFWTTLIANLGVILGLIFLVLEIRQNSAIAATQTRMEYASVWRNIDSARQDASFAALIAKSYDNAESLSVAEAIQLDAYYWGVLDQMLNAQIASSTGVRQGSFENTAHQTAALYFSNEFAQAWWRHARLIFSDPDDLGFRQVMDTAIERVQQSYYSNPYEDILGEIRRRQLDGNNAE